MKPLILLIAVFAAFSIVARFTTGNWQLTFGGNLAMCLMLCFTATGHFMFTKGMTMMMQGFIPFKNELVYVTGFAEILLGLCLLFPSCRYITGILLIAFFILILPANILAAIKHIDYQKGTFDGNGIHYLWFRIPLQIFFISWVYYFSVK